MLWKRTVALWVTALSLVACGDDQEDPPPTYDFSAVDAEVEALLSERGLAGAQLAIVHEQFGVIHLAGYGAHSADRISALASASKVPSAGVLMRLHDQGVIDLDAPVGSYLPASFGDARAMDFSVAQMLSNSSGMLGLVNEEGTEFVGANYPPHLCQFVNSADLLDCGSTIYGAKDANESIAPDTAFRYGGGQWQLAGAIASEMSGMGWEALLEETYRTPCDIDTFAYGNFALQSLGEATDENPAPYPLGLDGTAASFAASTNSWIEGGLYTTAADYGALLLMHLRGGVCDGGRVLSAESTARMRRDRIADEYDGSTWGEFARGYGLGWWVDREQPGVFYDPGAWGSVVWLDEDRGYAAVLLLEATTADGQASLTGVVPAVAEAIDAGP